ncbi:20S-pre-rRNA D-site endonuclease NOB1 [Cercospora zeina]
MATTKPVHTVVLDTGAIIKNEPPVSTLLNQAEELITVPAIISEIKDAATRLRVETTLKPFLKIRSPNPASVKFVTDFARKTGDLAVLSKPDVQIIALCYEIECERNGGDWRLRKVPGQKGLNGAPPTKEASESQEGADTQTEQSTAEQAAEVAKQSDGAVDAEAEPATQGSPNAVPKATDDVPQLASKLQNAALETTEPIRSPDAGQVDVTQNSAEDQPESESDSDSEGWITPSNLKKKQAEDAGASTAQTPELKTMQVGVLTSDFAMQNVILQINLNLLSPSMSRIKNLKTYVLRCHACFNVCKDLSKRFCPRCGQPTLTRVSCSTSANGEFKLHLKKNMQWNNRGNRYSVPKPAHGTANGKHTGGGKQGWGHDLILAEDQKEYERATAQERRTKERSLMDEDYLPSILTGDRNRTGGRTRVGAGRNVNSRKR